MGRVNYVADTNSPQEGRAAVRLCPHPLMVLDHVYGGGRDFHFLPKACVPNQKAMIEDRISISSSEKTFSIATANGMPVV